MTNLEKVKCKCWCCGKEFYTNSFNKIYCDECLAQHYATATSIPELATIATKAVKELGYDIDFQLLSGIAKKFIQTYGNPHTKIIIEQDGIEILNSEQAIPFEVND